MAFHTPVFLFYFLPLTLLLFMLLKPRWRGLFLLLASLVFYAWGEGPYLLVLVVSWWGNYLLARVSGAHREEKSGGAWFVAAILFNLGLLASFKYEPFIASYGPGQQLKILAHMPLGISFFTFQALSYLIDVRRGLKPAEKNPVHVGLVIALFPQIGAGPIIRYHTLTDQLRTIAWVPEKLNRGARRFVIGLAKKVLVASSLAGVADAVFAIPAPQMTAAVCWLGLLSYTLQIYFDFSGYSDMAIGLGSMIGLDYPENFSYPYAARSLRDFWARWHISLTTFLRDYVFLPVSSAISRRIRPSRLLGIRAEYWIYNGGMITTMALCGIWHGSRMTFLLWGLFHGLMLSFEQAFLRRLLKRSWPPLANLWTLLLVMLGWVLFRCDSIAHAGEFFKALVGLGHGDGRAQYLSLYLGNRFLLALAAAVIGARPVARLLAGPAAMVRKPWAGWVSLMQGTGLFLLLLASILVLAGDRYAPFLYVRF